MPRDGFEMLCEAMWGLVGSTLRGGMYLYRRSVLSGARSRAARKARDDERASRQQQQKWFETVERQKARGDAGFANEAEAQAALRGKGGRPSKLDDRWF